MTTFEQIFVHDCARRTNAIHARAEREYRQLLLTFVLLGLLLIGLICLGIGLKWEPGLKPDHAVNALESRQISFLASDVTK